MPTKKTRIMKSNFLQILIFYFIYLPAYSNGSSPIFTGSRIGSPLTSQHIDILKEYINITPKEDFERYIQPWMGFRETHFEINYVLQSDTVGKQIPLLFLAMSYRHGGMRLKVWLDGKIIPTTYQIPTKYQEGTNAFLAKFGHHFPKGEPLQFRFFDKKFYWYHENGYLSSGLQPLANNQHIPLHFFEIDLTKGVHNLRVEYTANSWENYAGDGWITRTIIPYSLAPAKNWKSFGGLEVRIDIRTLKKGFIRTNLGKPTAGKIDSVAIWQFNSLPADFIMIEYEPKLNAWVNLARYITKNTNGYVKDFLMLWLPLVMLPFIHLRYLWRAKNSQKSLDVMTGIMLAGWLFIPSVWLMLLGVLYWSVAIFIPSDHLVVFYGGIHIDRVYAALAYIWQILSVSIIWGGISLFSRKKKKV